MQAGGENFSRRSADENGGILMDAKYLAEIKAAFTTEMLTDDYREMRISEIAKLRLYGKKLLAEVERMTAEIATLKKEIEQLAEERDAAKRKKDELEAFYEQLCRNIAQEASK
jgi:uncharacterized protein YlxW (UPF0749 family)